jgi:hypothetical protein
VGLAQSNQLIRRRYGYLALPRPAGLRLPNHDDSQKEEQSSVLRRSTKHANLGARQSLIPLANSLSPLAAVG